MEWNRNPMGLRKPDQNTSNLQLHATPVNDNQRVSAGGGYRKSWIQARLQTEMKGRIPHMKECAYARA